MIAEIWKKGIRGCRVWGLGAVIFCIVLLAGGSATGADLNPGHIAERLQEAYDKTTSFSADFRQETSMRMSRRRRHGNGSVVILKPGRIRWDYQTPDSQILVSDGQTFSMYFAKLSQMIIQPINEYLQSDVTYAFFTGSGNIVKDFEVLPPDLQVEENHCIKLIPKEPHPQVDYFHICVDEKFLINRMQIVDQFGTVTDLYFSNIRTNEQPSLDFFTFTPPPGTEIIRQ